MSMNKTRIARIARLVALRQQQRRIREAEHAHAQRVLEQASSHKDRCAANCEALDVEHNATIEGELDPLDLELIGTARSAASRQLKRANLEALQAAQETEARLDTLLDAHRTHRSLELFHGRAETAFRRDQLRSEQRELDEFALRSIVTDRGA